MSTKQSQQMRAEMRRVLSGLDQRWLPAASRELSQQLTQYLQASTHKNISHVLAFLPLYAGEVDLSSFIAEQSQNYSIYLPRLSPDHSFDFVALRADWQEKLMHDQQGFAAPIDGDVFDYAAAEQTLVLVPGLAFDYWGARLGRGHHVYSKLLQSKLRSALKVGTCWSLQLVPELPRDNHLVLVDLICTENEMLKPKNPEQNL